MENCTRCNGILLKTSSFLTCETCRSTIHISCLTVPVLPTSIHGDTFFTLQCCECSSVSIDVIKRAKVNWMTALVIALYNLKQCSQKSSRKGYFHWKTDVAAFLEQNWVCILGPHMKKTKTWLGTISGILSHWPVFESGTSELGENGWWKLGSEDHPADVIASLSKPETTKGKAVRNTSQSQLTKRIRVDYKAKKEPENDWFKKIGQNVISAELPLELFHGEGTDESDGDVTSLHIESSQEYLSDFILSTSESFPPLDQLVSTICTKTKKIEEEKEEKEKRQEEEEEGVEEKRQEEEEEEEDTQPPKRKTREPSPENNCLLMSCYEEKQLLEKLNCRPSLCSSNLSARLLRRKLIVRSLQREKNLPVFDIDTQMKELLGIVANVKGEETKSNVLDRFKSQRSKEIREKEKFLSFRLKLTGRAFEEEEISRLIISPYTGRSLKPYIRRDFESTPLKLRLLRDIVRVTRGQSLKRAPIDYCYVQPHHIPPVNALASEFFWPGIDLSECLEYPDYSCVVLYRKIVIAFAFLVPDVSHTEAYLSFIFTHPEWRRAGIATFMVYHLIQTCMGKDITLHVSANNPAVMLYQKFGFKVEERILDFYDKYYPRQSSECKHSLFLRLTRC